MSKFRRKLLINLKEKDYSELYFTLHMLGDGNMTLYAPLSYTIAPSYSLNGGSWITFTTDITLPLKSNDKVRVKCITDVYTRSKEYGIQTKTFESTCEYEVYGNVMSLLYGDEFEGQSVLTTQCSFNSLFYDQWHLINAENLILPTTTLTRSCYKNMFRNCSSLISAPELPATTLASNCYYYMFYGCSSLTEAPVLPATKLAEYCYEHMFAYCIRLTTAPKLPVTTLQIGCYAGMFKDCINLNKIIMLATTGLEKYRCLDNWVNGVASSGTFVKNADMTLLPNGASGIPEGWDVITE